VNAKKARDAGHFDEEIVPVTVEQEDLSLDNGQI